MTPSGSSACTVPLSFCVGTDDVETASRRLRTLQTMGWKNYEEAKTHGGVVEEHKSKKLGANDYTEVHSSADEDGLQEGQK